MLDLGSGLLGKVGLAAVATLVVCLDETCDKSRVVLIKSDAVVS